MLRTELYGAGNDRDDHQRIRMDDWELRDEVQHAVKLIWPTVTTANLFEHTDYASYKSEFLKLFGFGVAGVDYAADVDPVVPFDVIELQD
jgi:enoyl-[acyl-carrier protein] reductase/trans-2-enoyl-CoA reductase (NAD+)